MTQVRLTYCGNVHPAEDLESWMLAVEEYAVPVAEARRRAGAAFGLGAWWNAETAQRLAEDHEALAAARRALDDNGLELWTLNVFPHGSFHGDRVKEAVYSPDWSREERVQYTRQAAMALAALCSPGTIAPLSTLPLGYRPPGGREPDLRLMARNLARIASALAALEDETGVRAVLALEPEPFCLLETAAGAADFLEQWLFGDGAWTVPESVLRRHLGICIDLCHLFVVREDPLAAVADLAARGVAVPKIQVSSCLEVRDPEGLEQLLAFDEPRYLHQTVAEDGPRALDLPEVRARAPEFAAAGRLRTHFHVPLFWDEQGAFGSTRSEVQDFLAGLQTPLPLLEVETYTWGVLPDLGTEPDLPANLARELDFAASHLARR